MATTSSSTSGRIFPADLEAFCTEAMVRTGLREEEARLSAQIFVTNDTWGIYTHGVNKIRPLMKIVRAGCIDTKATEEIVTEGPTWAIIDGHQAMPPAVSYRAMELAIRKAKSVGMAYVGVRKTSHFGTAGYYAVMAAQQGLIGLAMCNTTPGVTVPGARGKVLGTNPLAYAIPAGEERPVFLDIATSTVAASKLIAAAEKGQAIPDTWLVDKDGVPVTDPQVYYQGGAALLPMAGYKGYGIAFLVEVLTGALAGAGMASGVSNWMFDLTQSSDEGHAFMVIDVRALMPAQEFKERMDWLIHYVRQSPKAKGSERIYLPGEMEWEKREKALAEGIAFPADVLGNLAGLAEDTGLDWKTLLR